MKLKNATNAKFSSPHKMPSTRKQLVEQKAKARRSRVSDLLSHIENKVVMLGNPNFGDPNEVVDAYQREIRSTRASSSQENEIRSENSTEERTQFSLAESLERR